MEHSEQQQRRGAVGDSEDELEEEERVVAALAHEHEAEEDSKLDQSQLSEEKSACNDSNSVASSQSVSLDDLGKYARVVGEASSEKAPKGKRRVAEQASSQKQWKPRKSKKAEKPMREKRTRKKKQQTETQRIIMEQQCKLCFNRLVNPASASKAIDEVSLRNALERFNGQCDLQKLIPMMNMADPSLQPPLSSLSYEQFRRIFMEVQSHR